MAYILQVDFHHAGPFGAEMEAAFSDLARSINEEKGLTWKIWTENAETHEAGGIYLFETIEDAENYLTKHTKRLNGFGITDVRGKIFQANEGLSRINHGPIK